MVMKRFLAVVPLLCLAAVVVSQGRPTGPASNKGIQVPKSKFPPGLTPPIVPRARLLGFDNVIKELKCSPAQTKKIKAELGREIKNLPMEELRKAQLAKDQKVIAMLTGPQKARLTEISYQAIGILSLRSAPAAKAIGLTPAQDKKIVTKWDEIFRRARAVAKKDPQPKIDKNDPKREQKIRAAIEKHDMIYDKYRKEAETYAFTQVLSAAQVSKWKAIQGKPFAFTSRWQKL